MELRELAYLVALADELTFTRAAARCHISQQAFSRAIARLERRLGVTLVLRGARRCRLTAEGERVVASARGMLAAADDLLADLREDVDPATRLRVGVLLDGLGAATVPLLRDFRVAHPTVAVAVRRLHADAIVAALLDGSIDVAILHGPVTDERLEVLPLFTEPRVAAVSAAGTLADAPVLTAADLLPRPARVRRPDVPADWEGFFTLVPERDGEQPDRCGDPTRSLEELLYAIGLEDLFLTMPAHLAATYPGELYGVRYVPLPGLAPVTFGLAYRRPPGPAVRSLGRLARRSLRRPREALRLPGPELAGDVDVGAVAGVALGVPAAGLRTGLDGA
jgi:DNA-binding transcriptional LysR family regulator